MTRRRWIVIPLALVLLGSAAVGALWWSVQHDDLPDDLPARFQKTVVPGPADVTVEGDKVFVSPNFANYLSCGRPCSAPLAYEPSRLDVVQPELVVARVGPCEYFDPASYTPDRPYCASKINRGGKPAAGELPAVGDLLEVDCQTIAGRRRADVGPDSKVWLRVLAPADWIDPAKLDRLTVVPDHPELVYAWVPNVFMGNHDLPVRRC